MYMDTNLHKQVMARIHPHYLPKQVGILIPGNKRFREQYFEQRTDEYIIDNSFKAVTHRCSANLTPDQHLRIDEIDQAKTKDQIWDETGVRNSMPDVLIERVIFIGPKILTPSPMVIGFFEDNPVWAFRTRGRLLVEVITFDIDAGVLLLSPDIKF